MNLNITSPITYNGSVDTEYGRFNFTAQVGNKTVEATYRVRENKIEFQIRADIESLGIVIDDTDALAALADFAKVQQASNYRKDAEKKAAERKAAYANSIHVKLGRLIADNKLPDCGIMNYQTEEEYCANPDNHLEVFKGEFKINIVLCDGKFVISKHKFCFGREDRKTSKIEKVPALVLENLEGQKEAKEYKAKVAQHRNDELAKMIEITGCTGLKRNSESQIVLPMQDRDWDSIVTINSTGNSEYRVNLKNVPESKLREVLAVLGLVDAQ